MEGILLLNNDDNYKTFYMMTDGAQSIRYDDCDDYQKYPLQDW